VASAPSNAKQVERVVADAVAVIMEHCDTVQILATVQERGQTFRIRNGRGNWYARVGLCREFVDIDRAQSENTILKGSQG
jgi:hypothetical protein